MGLIVPSLLLALAGGPLTSTAHAGSPWDKLLTGASGSSISAPVDLDLYSLPSAGSRPLVFVNIGEERFLVAVDPNGPAFALSDAAAGKLGAKVKSTKVNDAEQKYFDVDEVRLGDATLTGVRILTAAPDAPGAFGTRGDPLAAGDRQVDGVLGLGALTDQLSFALLPSEGVLRIAPASQGATLVSAVGGATLDTRRDESDKIKFGKNKYWDVPNPMLVATKHGEQEWATVLSWSVYPSKADTAVALGDAVTRRHLGDMDLELRDFGIAGVTDTTWVLRNGASSLSATAEGANPSDWILVGLDVLEGADVAFDPASRKLALKPASKQVRKDALPELLADAQTANDEAIAESKEAEKPADAEPTPDGNAGAWQALAEVQMEMGGAKNAIASWKKVVAFDDASADAHYHLGEAQFAADQLDDAKASFQTAHDLCHAWWDDSIPLFGKWADLDDRQIALKTRATLAAQSRAKWSEAIAKLEKQGRDLVEGGVPEGLKPQPGATCGEVDAALAATHLARFDSDAASALYDARAPHDKVLPYVEGNRALAKKELDKANSAYRQVMRMDLTGGHPARLGAAVTASEKGDWTTAAPLFELVADWAPGLATLRLWSAGIEKTDGADAALKAIAEVSDTDPTNIAAALVYAQRAKAAGDAAATKKALDRATPHIDGELAMRPRSAALLVAKSWAHFLSEDLPGARKAAEKAVGYAPQGAEAWLVLSEIAAAEGKTDEAAKARRRAANGAGLSPEYALLASEMMDGKADAN